jgi:hypothetical protein
MALLLFSILVVLVVVFIVRGGRATARAEPAPFAAARASVTTEDIPAVLAALSATGTDSSFAVFLFGEGGQLDSTQGKPPLRWHRLSQVLERPNSKYRGFLGFAAGTRRA